MCMYGLPLWRLLYLLGLSQAKPQGACSFLKNLMVLLPLRMSEWCVLSLGGSPYVGSFMEAGCFYIMHAACCNVASKKMQATPFSILDAAVSGVHS